MVFSTLVLGGMIKSVQTMLGMVIVVCMLGGVASGYMHAGDGINQI